MKREVPLERLLGKAVTALRDGRIVDALDALLDAEKVAPRNASVFVLRADAHLARGAPADAILDLAIAARHAGDDVEPARRLADLLSRYTLDDPTELDRRGLLAALAQPGVAQSPLAAAALSLWWRTDVPADVRASSDAAQAATALLGRRVAPCLSEPLFHAALRAGANIDPAIERLLTAVRARLLAEGPERLLEDRARADLAIALLAQAMENEYVWVETANEAATVDALAVTPEALARAPVEASGRFLLRALYRPLDQVATPPLDAAAVGRLVPKTLRALVAARRAAEADEARIATTLPTLAAPSDATSAKVARQYEASPYPRWRTLHAPPSGRLRQMLGRFAGRSVDPFADRSIRVLIAGAGTGQQALRAAVGYRPADVTALDLSRASLAYGARMAGALGIGNVRFLHGDLLDLDRSTETFDVIECIGVLHHMADPLAGWRTLCGRLAPGGLMYVGLYSARARREITALRTSDPEWPGTGATNAEARTYRARLLARADGALGAALRTSHDFYTASDFRDLVLHAHEAPVTLAEVAGWLEALGLTFLGFTLPGEIVADFQRRHPGRPGRLVDWADYEDAHPRTFEAMYCFWCRRAGDD